MAKTSLFHPDSVVMTRLAKSTLAQRTVGSDGTGVVGEIVSDGTSVVGGLVGWGVRNVGTAVGAIVPQSFSYHATVSSLLDAESASTSPSPSTSIAKTDMTRSAEFVIMRCVKDWDPSFSYHATVSSALDADRTSTSPSPSTSIAKIPTVKSVAAFEMTIFVNETLAQTSE